MSNEVETKKEGYKTQLVKANDAYLSMIEKQMEDHDIAITEYGKVCVVNAVGAINELLASNGLTFGSKELDTSSLTSAFLTAATLQLNAKAVNREIYFQLRNKKLKVNGADVWMKQIEWGIEGDGWDALISKFGRNIHKVYPFWLVRSGDKYTPPRHRGLEVTPPEWEESGVGEVVRVVYPIAFTDGSIEYFTCERDDVLKNLYAHINNNLMNETFGVCKDRFSATPEEKEEIAKRKKAILDRAKEIGWGALDDDEVSKYISPSWTDFHSRESMIIRKMRNRICKKIPKDLGSAYASDVYNSAADENYQRLAGQVEKTTGEVIEADFTESTEKATPNF